MNNKLLAIVSSFLAVFIFSSPGFGGDGHDHGSHGKEKGKLESKKHDSHEGHHHDGDKKKKKKKSDDHKHEHKKGHGHEDDGEDHDDHGMNSDTDSHKGHASHDSKKEKGTHDDHGHEGEEDPNRAISSVQGEGKKFSLSKEALKALNIEAKPLVSFKSGGKYIVPTNSLVYYQNEVGIFVLDDSFFQLVSVTLGKQIDESREVTLSGISKESKLVVRGAPLLRIAHLQASGQGGHGHAH